ncbi:MAG: TauD/TfdA family dioxygenase [Burkholderiales bacterium]
MQIRPANACLGAEIDGLDLAAPLTDATFREVRDALHTHHVLAFRAQRLTATAFLDFARRFAVPEPHVLDQFHHSAHPEILILSNVRENGQPTGLADGGTYWHSDYSYLEIPARATLLYSITVPRVGGDTLFADQEKAYADLPEAMRTRIDGLVGLHLYGNRDDLDEQSRLVAFPLSEAQKEKRNITVIRHPIVRQHPFTRRKALYAVSGTSIGIEGMPDDEALALLRELAAFSTRPAYQLRVEYGVGDVVMWDNASVLHSATLTHPDDPRTLWRITTKEVERP